MFIVRWLWWLVLCVNLTELNHAQTAGKTTFLGGTVRMFQEEISIWFGILSKEGRPHLCEQALSNPLRAWIEQKGRERANLPSVWAGQSIFSCPLTLAQWITTLASQILQLVNGRSWNFLGSLTVWGNFYNNSVLIYHSIYSLLVLFLERTLTDTMALPHL